MASPRGRPSAGLGLPEGRLPPREIHRAPSGQDEGEDEEDVHEDLAGHLVRRRVRVVHERIAWLTNCEMAFPRKIALMPRRWFLGMWNQISSVSRPYKSRPSSFARPGHARPQRCQLFARRRRAERAEREIHVQQLDRPVQPPVPRLAVHERRAHRLHAHEQEEEERAVDDDDDDVRDMTLKTKGR